MCSGGGGGGCSTRCEITGGAAGGACQGYTPSLCDPRPPRAPAQEGGPGGGRRSADPDASHVGITYPSMRDPDIMDCHTL